MRKQLVDLLETSHELRQFIHEQPIWYRKLTRNPLDINAFQHSAKQYYQKTLPQRVDKISNSIELATMMLQMFQAMKSND